MNAPGFFDIVFSISSLYIIVLLGVFLRRFSKLESECDKSILWLIINVCTPCLILDSILKNPALDQLSNVTLSPIIGFLGIAIGLALATLCVKLSGITKTTEKRAFIFSNSLYNYGYIPIPLILHLYDRDTLGVLMVHNVGVEAALWSIALMALNKGKDGSSLKALLNAPFFAVVSALILNITNMDDLLPQFFLRSIHMIGQVTIPLALLIVGAILSDYLALFSYRDNIRLYLSTLLVRMLLFPLCYLLIAFLLPCSIELKKVMIIQSAMPAAILPVVIAKQYGASPEIALQVSLITSVVSIITMPFWIQVGTLLIHI